MYYIILYGPGSCSVSSPGSAFEDQKCVFDLALRGFRDQCVCLTTIRRALVPMSGGN